MTDQPPRTVVCAVSCCRPSGFPLVAPANLLRHAAPDTVVTRVVYTAADGAEFRTVHALRVGDYFSDVTARTVPTGDPDDRRVVSLTFHVRPGAGAMWKAVVVEVLNRIRALEPGLRAEVVWPSVNAGAYP